MAHTLLRLDLALISKKNIFTVDNYNIKPSDFSVASRTALSFYRK